MPGLTLPGSSGSSGTSSDATRCSSAPRASPTRLSWPPCPSSPCVIGLLSAFGALEDLRARLQDALVTRLLPSNHAELAALLDQFLAGASKVGLVGFVFLILTAILLMDAVESSFNQIWQVSTRRRLISKVTAYTSVLVFGSLFIGASLSISARLKTALILHGPALDPGLVSRLQSLVFPLLLSLLAFLLMFVVIPFTRVHWTSALLGALVGSVLWEVAKSLFALSVGSSVRYSTLYGSLAAIPIFLIWLNITWIIVLLGLEVAYTHQHFHALRRERLWRSAGSGARLALGLKLYAALARAFDRGEATTPRRRAGRALRGPLERRPGVPATLRNHRPHPACGDRQRGRRGGPGDAAVAGHRRRRGRHPARQRGRIGASPTSRWSRRWSRRWRATETLEPAPSATPPSRIWCGTPSQ